MSVWTPLSEYRPLSCYLPGELGLSRQITAGRQDAKPESCTHTERGDLTSIGMALGTCRRFLKTPELRGER